MNRKERRAATEASAIAACSVAAAIALPTMISARDSMAVLAGFILLAALCGWIAAFFIRLCKENAK